MDKITFDINEIFRYLLSGGWTLACYFFIRPSEIEEIGKNGVNLVILAMIVGSMIYVIYRALFYPLWYKILYRILFWLKIIEKKDHGLKYFVWPSKIEIEDNFRRWAQRYNGKSFSSKHITLWGSQVHFLFSSAFGSLFSIFYSNIAGDSVRNRVCWVAVSCIILFVAAMVSSSSLVLYDLKVDKMEEDLKKVAGNEKGHIY